MVDNSAGGGVAGAQGAAVAGAAAGIQNVSAGMASVASSVANGSLTLSQDAAKALLGAIGQLQDQANDLISLADTIDKPLHFGHNWVGMAMDNRLRAVAAGQNSSIRPVLIEFANVLSEAEATIAKAANLTVSNDEDQSQLLLNAGKLQ